MGLSRWVTFFILGSFLSNVGTWMQVVAQGWLVAGLTKEPFWNGFIGFCNGIPLLLFSLVGGILADRVNRRRLFFITQIALMLISIVFTVLTLTHLIALWQVAVLAFLMGLTTALNNPTAHSFIYDIVHKSKVTSTVSLNIMQIHLSRMLGPGLAGLILSLAGPGACFVFNSISFLAVLPVIALIPRVNDQDLATARKTTFWKSAKDAIAYARGEKTIAFVLKVTAVIAICLMQHVTLLALYVREELHLGADVLGWLWVCSALGSVGMSAFCTRFPFRSTTQGLRRILLGGLLSGVFLFGFALVKSSAILFPVIFLLGAAIGVVSVTVQTLIQTTVIPAMRGRVLGLWGTLFQGLFPVGSLLVGALAQATSVAFAWKVASLGLIAAMLWVWRKAPV